MSAEPDRIGYVAVGSNIEPRRNLPAALTLLRQAVSVLAVSRVYRTAPIGRPGQPEFLNAVWQIRTALSPWAVKFDVLRPIEDRLGRVRGGDPYGPRTIDLDLVLLGACVVRREELTLPSEDLDRPFVALPLLELAPDVVLPDTGETLSSLWSDRPRPPDMLAEEALSAQLRGSLLHEP